MPPPPRMQTPLKFNNLMKPQAFSQSNTVFVYLQLLPIAAVALTVPFNKVAFIHQRNDTGWFNITLKFPFHYDNKTAIYTNETIPPNFAFGQQVEICSWLFVGINGAWFIMAAAILVSYISAHGGEKMEKVATMVR